MNSVCNFCSFFFHAQAERHAVAELTYLNFFPAFCNHVNQDSFSLSDRNPALNWLWIKREICRLTILNIASGIARSRCSNNIIRSEFSTSLDSAVPLCFPFSGRLSSQDDSETVLTHFFTFQVCGESPLSSCFGKVLKVALDWCGPISILK